MTNNDKSPLTMRDVGRLAPASIDVVTKNADKAAIAALTATLVPAANAVLVAMGNLATLRNDQVVLIARSDEQTAVLNGLMLGWSGPLVRDIEGFDIGAFARAPGLLTFDVVQKAISLKQLVEQKGAGLPYRETLLTELTARIESASEAERSAHAARSALQQRQREVRELIGAFYKELVSLRRTVRAVLGSKSFDYQRLRVPVRAEDEPPVDAVPVTEPTETEGEPSAA